MENKCCRSGKDVSISSHVRFGYEPGQPLMKDITLHVPAGSRVAIVGRTGAGKTTLVNLLMRFYEIEGGQILIDDQDIRRCTRDSLRRQFGMVLQDTCLFEGTIAENIAFGKPEASRREIEEAARRSGAHEFIRRLDKGYESLIRADSDMLSQGTAAAAGHHPGAAHGSAHAHPR